MSIGVELAQRAMLWLMLMELVLVLAVISFAILALGLRAVLQALLRLLRWR